MRHISKCPCCGHTTFEQTKILWPELIKAWGLTPKEVAQVNRQQGLACTHCHSNLRSMTLAAAVMRCYGFAGTLEEFASKQTSVRVLEINEAGHLSPYFQQMPHHTLANYPDVDIMNLPYSDHKFDLIVHSDTLEHVKDPVQALKESWRVLKPGGFTCFTIPMVVGRSSKRRQGKSASYHGTPGQVEYLVYTEYGSDAWTQLMEAGFAECRLVSLDYPASVAIVGVKTDESDSSENAR